MILILFLLGVILFLPYYSAALEVRLKREKKFQPFRVMENLRVGAGGRYVLPVFGMMLMVLGLNVYLFSDEPSPVSDEDLIRVVLAVLLVGSALFYGYMRKDVLVREAEGVDSGAEGLKYRQAKKNKIACALKALRDLLFVCAVFILFFVLKHYVIL